jgi:hypothetical protein
MNKKSNILEFSQDFLNKSKYNNPTNKLENRL